MIVYRDQRSPADPRRLLLELRSAASLAGTTAPAHTAARELLIEAGKLESALADALFPESDGIHPLSRTLRQASVDAGHVFWHTWRGNPNEAKWWAARLGGHLESIAVEQLPTTAEISVPEGYAYYSVYPESYLEAAKRCAARLGALNAVCLGLRSIGTSLSAVVTAALEEQGCRVETFTVRPRGHPFSRCLRMTPELTDRIRSTPHAYVLLVDEGPGISGSSIGGAAALLQSWGFPDERILLFPSWQTDGSHLASPQAQEHWARHPQFTVPFEEVWLDSGRLNSAYPGTLRDVSAGRWRQEVYQDISEYPPIHPQHERRKYLLTSHGASGGTHLLSFAGLERETSKKVDRLARLAEAGFTPRPERLEHGFLLRRFVPGRPVSSESASRELIERVASYLAHLSREHQSEPSVTHSSLREMTVVNLAEALKESVTAGLTGVLPAGEWLERPVALDGRMLAHEWIDTDEGFLKMDAMDHHDDHFFPGRQDIAWDVAASAVELELDRDGRGHLVALYRRLSGDRSIVSRLPHYGIAYLAFRLGYVSLAATMLGGTEDGQRFTRQIERYTRMVRSELNRPGSESWRG